MTNEFTLNIRVSLDATDRLCGLLERWLPDSGRQGTHVASPMHAQDADNVRALSPEPAGDMTEAPGTTQETAGQAGRYTELDVREAMHKARQRIEGEDYKDNTEGELYKKYHREMSRWFKRTAEVTGGADKPSALPPDKREAFIKECERVAVLDDGTIGVNPEF